MLSRPRGPQCKMMSEDGASLASPDSGARLETEKRELIDKLKKAVGAGKAMKKQLDDARAHNKTQQQELELKDDEKQELGLKLQDVVARYQAMQQQLEGKDGELQVALSKVEAFQVELQAQQDAAAETQDKMQTKCTQEEARVMVFQEEKNRLTHQVAAMLEEKQQQEREIQHVVKENEALQNKVQDLMQQVSGARQQQEDTEQMYLEVASKLNQALRDNDELTQGRGGAKDRELEKIQTLEAELAASIEKWEQEKQQFTQQIEALTASNEKVTAEMADVAEIREQLLLHVGIDLTYESIESLLDTKSNEIRMLTEQLAAVEAPQEQAIREAVSTAVAEAERLSTKLETLQTQYDALAAEKSEQDKTVEELRAELERVAEEHSSSLFAKEDEHRRVCEEKQTQIEQLTAQLDETQTQKQFLTEDFSTIKSKIEDMIAALQIGQPEFGTETSQNSRLVELEAYLEHIHKQFTGAAKPDLEHIQCETKTLKERIHKYEEENRLLVEKLEECEAALKARASDIEKFATRGLDTSSDSEKWVSSGEYAGSVVSNGETAESCNGDASDLEHELEITKAQLHAIEAEMAACKAENLRMIFEVAKTADGVSKLKQDHETLLVTHQEKSSELDTVIAQLEALQSANQKLESDLKSKSDDLRHHLEVSGMQKEDFLSVIDNLNSVVVKAEEENSKIKRDLKDIKTENDVLEERISELHAVADSKTEPDESQEKDREVEELRSSLVQAKVNFLEQKQQLTALEKKLVEVSKSSGPACTVNSASLDAERREFEAALIEMIEMEKKLQVAYEAKQGLESTLQERMVAKAELEDRLSVAEDKIAELEQQLEQKVALIATIDEQLRSVEEEREKLADEFAKTKSKLERSRGKLEEKVIEFEAFKTTTNMLKDERSRLFNEIALLKDKIAKSEVQKVAMADSQELANEELEEQLNELADKIAEIEIEKQELRARLEETVYRSEEDIHQLRERLYMLEEEKSGIDDENLKLEKTIELLEAKLNSLEEQKAELEAANESSSEQLTLLEERVEKATSEIATLSAEKNSMTELQQSLEENVSALQDDKAKLEQTLEETTSKLRQELELVTAQVEAVQGQLMQSATEKDKVSAALSELQERAQADKLASEEVAGKLESQIAENKTLENKISVLKQMAERALQSLQANRDELSEAESRADVLAEERDAVKTLLHEKQSAYEELAAQRKELQQQVEKLRNELESLHQKHSEETGAAEETIRGLKEAESTLTESLESVKQDLAEAESCVMVLVEERDAARKELTAKDLKIEMMTSQQGELDLAAQNLENELKTLRSKSSADAEATEEMIRDLKEAKTQAEDTARILNDSTAQAEESLQAIQEKLAESELRVIALEKERDATRTSLNEKESTQETLSALQEDLQNKVAALEMELKELSKTSSTELAGANETITHLKNAEAEEAETLASLRQELAEAEGCVMVLVEERDDAKKTLSKRDLTLEVLSSEHGELQLKNQSVTTELEALRNKSAADAQAAEETVKTLKEEVKRATESLESAQKELLESEARVAALNAECDVANKTLGDLEAEHKCLSTQKEDLQERIESQKVDMVNLQSQHSAELVSAEETICALKTSETEVTNLLQSVRQELSNIKAHAESSAEEHNAAKIALDKQQVTINNFESEVAGHKERIQSLEGELQELQSQREAETHTAEETIRSLKESESQTAETLEAIRQQLSETEARVVSAEEEREAASKAVSEMESHREAQRTEVESLQERIQSLEGELQELQSQREAETHTAEETIRSLKESESQTAETLEAIRQQLSETEARVVSAEEEREAASKAVSEMESHREAQRTEVESLQERIQSLEGELQELQSQREAETHTAEETIRSLKESESQTAETLEAIRQQLSETEARVVSAEEEREAASKAVSEMESHREAQRTEVESLQERIQSLEGELQELQSQREAETHTAEETIRSLKESESQTAETLEAIRQQLSETEARVVSAEEEREAASKAVSEMESHREAQRTEVESLQERIQSLEGELQELQSQREAETHTAEETIRSLKESESQTAETLEAIRQQLSETEARVVSAEEEREAASKAVSEMESHREAQRTEVESLQERIQSLEGELQELQSQREAETQKEIEVANLREQKATQEESHAVCIAQKDEVISTLKSKLEEVMAAYKRLKGHLQELQDRLTQQTTTNDSLKTSYNELNAQHAISIEELDALKLDLASSREQSGVIAEELRQAAEKFAEAEAQRDSQMENFKKRVLAYDYELAQMQKQHDVALHEQKETLLAASAARDEAAQLKASELEKSLATLTETVESKELELQSTKEHVHHLEQKHAQVGSDHVEANRRHETERMELEAQLSSANETIENLRSATDTNVNLQSHLKKEVAKLKLEVEAEMEGANAARVALETYKKRAHTALKKASSENKLNLKKAAQSTTNLEKEVVAAKGRVSTLETELEETRKRMAELESVGDARVQSAREALEAEKRSQEVTMRLEIDSLKAEVTRLKGALENERVHLEATIKQLTERNKALNHEVSSLREEVRTQNEGIEQAVQLKEEEISDLSKQLQAALAAAASLATNEAGRRSYSPATSPTDKERRSTASSSRSFDSEGNNSFLHQSTVEEHIATAVADSCPIPLASKMSPANGVDHQSNVLVDEDEVVRLKLLLNELETKSHLYQKKYEDTSALLEEASRHKQRLQELDERSTQAINIEYLKNVVMKYIESQVPSEKEQLVPVISTLLRFSPQEHQKVMAAHSKANDEGAGLFGGVFSIFGGSAATVPPPKPLAAPHNFKPSSTTTKSNITGAALGSKDKNGVLSFGSDPSDDEEFATPLNPFAA